MFIYFFFVNCSGDSMIVKPKMYSLDELKLSENELETIKQVVGEDSNIIAEKFRGEIIIAVNGKEYTNENNVLGFIGEVVDKHGRITFINITDSIRAGEKPPFEHLVAVINKVGEVEFEIQDYFGKVVGKYKLMDIYYWSNDIKFKVVIDSIKPVTKNFRTPWRSTVKMYSVHVKGKVLIDGYEIPLDTDVNYRSALYGDSINRAKMDRWDYVHVFSEFVKIFEKAQEIYQQGYLDKNIDTLKGVIDELNNVIVENTESVFSDNTYFNSKVYDFVNRMAPYLPRDIEVNGSRLPLLKFFFLNVAEGILDNIEKIKNNAVITRIFTEDMIEEFIFYTKFKDMLPSRIKGLILSDVLFSLGFCFRFY